MAQGLPAEEMRWLAIRRRHLIRNVRKTRHCRASLFSMRPRARIDAAVDAEIGFTERLVWFWSNHFCISADKVMGDGGALRARSDPAECARPFRRHAAARREPSGDADLSRQRQSIGPNSVAGINRDKGLNENLAREILELHTLGVRTGYTQDDVTRFAKVITGWTWTGRAADPEHGGEFVFNKRMHEPGARPCSARSIPTPAWSRAARCSRSGAPAGDRDTPRRQACAPLHRRPAATAVGR